MRVGFLLEKLIQIAETSKTDFALSMNMTPSGLSKILKSRRLPFLKEKNAFSRQAAAYFSEAIYESNCHIQLEPVFPILYAFESQQELEGFLSNAIEYALNKEYSEDNNDSYDFRERESCFIGAKQILNMFCILTSDYLTSHRAEPLQFYSTLLLFSRQYSDIFRRLKIVSSKKREDVFFNYFINTPDFKTFYDLYHLNVLYYIVRMQQFGDLNLWTMRENMDSTFFMLRGEFLMLFHTPMDGTPFMTVVTNKRYLASYFGVLQKKGAKKISFTKSEAVAALETDPAFVNRLLKTGIDTVYNFTAIGYLVKKESLDKLPGSEMVKSLISTLFKNLFTEKTMFYASIDALMSFYRNGKTIVPLVGSFHVPMEERMAYLKEFDAYLAKDDYDKITLISSDMPQVAMFHLSGLTIVYLSDSDFTSEKIYVFESDLIDDLFKHEIATGGLKSLPFSREVWESHVNEWLSHSYDHKKQQFSPTKKSWNSKKNKL